MNSHQPTKLKFEVWAQLFLADQDCDRVRDFLINEAGIRRKHVLKKMHLTVYHSRRPMHELTTGVRSISIVVPTAETRFMVLWPGGENPRPEIDPGNRKVGVRVQWQSRSMTQIQLLRRELIAKETSEILGNRSPSGKRRSAFGARSFQPHIALIRAGSGIGRDLSLLGEKFRSEIGNLTFDRFLVEMVCHVENPPPNY